MGEKMRKYTLEEFVELTKPKTPISREELEKLSDEELDQMMTKKYGFPRFGTWGQLNRDRNVKIDFIINGDYSKVNCGNEGARII